MRALEILDEAGHLRPEAAMQVLLAMAYPDDPVSQDVFIAGAKAESKSGQSDDWTPSYLFKHQMKLVEACSPGGQLAGEMLLHLLSLKAHAPEHASLNKVRWICRHHALEGWSLVNGQSVPATDTSYKGFWRQYRPVCHFWASWALHMDQGPAAVIQLFIDDDALLRFLSISAGLLVVANHFEIFDADVDAYTIPKSLAAEDVVFGVPPPTPWALKVLSEYRAPVGQK